jgi:hypothetical protein
MASESPTAGPRYHVVGFERDVQAAAFVAALARALDSRTLTANGAALSIEVWSGRPAQGGAFALYLSDGAFEAATEAFAPIPGNSVSDELPADCRRIIDRLTPPLGLEEALELLSTEAKERTGP